MKNVTINGKVKEVRYETPLRLNNGSLVVHYNRLGDVLGAYIVTSYRGANIVGGTTHHCSFVNLDNGYIEFEERCSRNTTIARVLSHLNHGDYTGRQAVTDGQYVEVYNGGNYKIDLLFRRGESNE